MEFAELTGVPVVPTLMGWGTLPDEHELNAGMVGLQTSHRYGNAAFLESDFVLGIGNRWANRHTGEVSVYTGAAHSCTGPRGGPRAADGRQAAGPLGVAAAQERRSACTRT